MCRNHIRIYVRPNDDSNSLFVCGTQSGIEPQCRMLNVSVCKLAPSHVFLALNDVATSEHVCDSSKDIWEMIFGMTMLKEV